MMRYLDEVEARIPKLNPDFDLEAYQKTEVYEKRVAYGPFEGKRQLGEDEK